MTSQSAVYREEQREIAIGERIQLNETITLKGIRKGDFATVTAISESNDLEVRTDKG
jgi:acyl-[acyl carrier protein]--UDP-N-acetylglucosamine O-acyltransferase